MTNTNPDTTATSPFPFDNTYARELPEAEGFWVATRPAHAPEPRMVAFNRELAAELGLDADRLDGEEGTRWFAGAELPPGAQPLAQVYAGHQFGGFVHRLGDGRALLLGEVIDRTGARRDVQLKGSGPTLYSRGGDGLAGLGPVLREYLLGEAMHALGIPTTRALAAVTTGGTVYRETPSPGAVLTRVAASHLRVGTFQYFAARGEVAQVKRLADYAIARHDPELAQDERPVLRLLEAVCARQASLVARWMHVGFVHGVMNTDNTTISGETIDYGPCAFMDRFDPATVFSSIDHMGRYAYGRQPEIAMWNLARFAETLLPLLDEDEDRAVEAATEAVTTFGPRFEASYQRGMRAKLGLETEREGDAALGQELLGCLHDAEVDFTQAFRSLAPAAAGHAEELRALFACTQRLDVWLDAWKARLALEERSAEARTEAMQRTNPVYVPRNHKVEEALEAAVERGDTGPFHALHEVLRRPFEEQPGREAYAEPAPEGGKPYMTFCGT